MKIRIKSEKFRFTLPAPLSMGSILIRCIPNDKLSKEQKIIVLKHFKIIKKSLKAYKGLKIVEVKSQSGEHITITI